MHTTDTEEELVSVICPCYREENNIEPLVAEIEKVFSRDNLNWELLLINDGSPDGTWDKISEVAKKESRIRGLNLSRNFGKEAAMLAGLQAATGSHVVIMDADLQHPPELILEMYRIMNATGAGQVVARRTRDGEPWLRKTLTRVYYRLVNRLIDVELVDGIGDFRMLSREAVYALLQLTERNRFSKGLFEWIGFDREIIDYRNVERVRGDSSWSFFQLMNYGLDGVIAFNDRPLRLAIKAGFFAVFLGLAYLAWMFIDWLVRGTTAPGYMTTIAAIVLFSGAQLVFLGLAGEYIGRIHTEVKKRPHYIISETTGSISS